MSPASPSPPDQGPSRGVIFEFTRFGDQIKVCAIDVSSGLEATVFGPATAAQADMERLALNKLRYIGGKIADAAPPPGGPPAPPKRGKLV
jgi:uncharacterized protein YqfB (UPF0267 family)